LDGNPLGSLIHATVPLRSVDLFRFPPICQPGYFAVKKIAVGESHSYLLKILREVRFTSFLFYSLKIRDSYERTGSPARETSSSKYNNLSSCLAGDMPVLIIRAKSTDPSVSFSSFLSFDVAESRPFRYPVF